MDREVLIKVEDEPNGNALHTEFSKIQKLFDECGGDSHGQTIIAQIFGCSTGAPHYFLTGRVLDVEESKALHSLLAKKVK